MAWDKTGIVWAKEFGQEYTDRNLRTMGELDSLYMEWFGVSRTDMNYRFLNKIGDRARGSRILEVGCNVGLQLQFLQEMGFTDLWGIELSDYAVELAKTRTKHINIIRGNAFVLPFKDKYFDLVFTSGLLIHIKPDKLYEIMGEICRCSRRWVWGMEYFENEFTEVYYRGCDDILYKGDYSKMYCDYHDTELIDIEIYTRPEKWKRDVMFLLEKK